jgi:hypothetical protein
MCLIENIVRARSWLQLHQLLFDNSFNESIGRFRSNCEFRGLADASYELQTSLMRLGGRVRDRRNAVWCELGSDAGDWPGWPRQNKTRLRPTTSSWLSAVSLCRTARWRRTHRKKRSAPAFERITKQRCASGSASHLSDIFLASTMAADLCPWGLYSSFWRLNGGAGNGILHRVASRDLVLMGQGSPHALPVKTLKHPSQRTSQPA